METPDAEQFSILDTYVDKVHFLILKLGQKNDNKQSTLCCLPVITATMLTVYRKDLQTSQHSHHQGAAAHLV